MNPHHEHATTREAGKAYPHQLSEPSLHAVANHGRANRTANNKAYLRRLTTGNNHQVGAERPPSGPSPRALHELELLWPPDSRLPRQHDASRAAGDTRRYADSR